MAHERAKESQTGDALKRQGWSRVSTRKAAFWSFCIAREWARLLKRVFDIDIERCPHCGGALRIIAAIEELAVIAKILAHRGLPVRAPPRSPARPLERFRAA